VAFQSYASTLVNGDSNGVVDVFVHDRETGQTIRVSVASDGSQGNGDSLVPSISADGRYVAFESHASNLVGGDDNSAADVFVHDRETGQTARVSVTSAGEQGIAESLDPSISADGRFIAFSSFASNLVNGDGNVAQDIFVHDRETAQTTLVSVATDGVQGNGDSMYPFISADGRFVAFFSWAETLVSDDNNFSTDVFVHDRETGQTELVSVASDGTQGIAGSLLPSISADGRYVAFMSYAGNLVWGDGNHAADIFVHDRETGQTTRVSVTSEGGQTIVDSWYPSISADGRYVAFDSASAVLVSGDSNGLADIFVHDRETGQTTRVSVASDGAQGNGDSVHASISADGRYVAFHSYANTLVPGDSNNFADVFIYDRPNQ
jgi:Tol biopolymer transport system component